MPNLTDFFNLCCYCVYAPCICGNDPENCASYVNRHGIELPNCGAKMDGERKGDDGSN